MTLYAQRVAQLSATTRCRTVTVQLVQKCVRCKAQFLAYIIFFYLNYVCFKVFYLQSKCVSTKILSELSGSKSPVLAAIAVVGMGLFYLHKTKRVTPTVTPFTLYRNTSKQLHYKNFTQNRLAII